MYKEYPFTAYFHDIDEMCKHCHHLGYRLEVHDDYLKLIDRKGNVISAVKIHFAETALTDIDGRAIKTYIYDVVPGETTIAFTHGTGEIATITIPYSTKAKEDVYGKDLSSYAYELSIAGDKLNVTKGDGTNYELTIPYAVKAEYDIDMKPIQTYAAKLAVDGDAIALYDAKDRELYKITVPYAIKAKEDVDGDDIKNVYGHSITTGTTTVKLLAKDGAQLSEITVPYAVSATQDTDGNKFLSDYAEKLVVDGDNRRIGVEAHDGTRLSTITVPFSILSTDAENAFETVQVVGDNIIFTTHGGVSYSITAPYAVKAQKDDNGNTIKNTYIASVENDPDTGELIFKDATGKTIATLIPTVTRANMDSYGNVIANYIKTVVADPQSDYVTFTHGTGDVDTITVPYSLRAWKDSLGQPIQNTYLTDITFEFNEDQGRYEMVLWNGDIPRAEVGRVVVIADRARTDVNGREITSYVGNVEADSGHIDVTNGNDEIISRITAAVDVVTVEANTISGWTYDNTQKALVWQPGTPVVVAEESREVAFDNM